MVWLSPRAFFFSFGLTLLASQAHGQYQVVDLTPPGIQSAIAYSTAGGVQVGSLSVPGYVPVQWNGSAGTVMSFDMLGADGGEALATDGVQAIGYLYGSFGNHGVLWNVGSPAATDLNPPGWDSSYTAAVSQGYQVGFAQNYSYPGPYHAMVWSGSAASAIDISPPGFLSIALGISGTDVVGYTTPNSSSLGSAALWHGFNNSPINLNPAPGDTTVGSSATCVSGSQQGGYVYYQSAGTQHAAIWSGTGASMVDLNPDPSILSSYVAATNGSQQCGQVSVGSNVHAAVWSGTASSFVDLSTFIAGTVEYSNASGIDSAGNITGYAVIADPVTGLGYGHAILWKYAPVTNHISVFQQPINDPASPESSFKKGSTVPVKFSLTDAHGAAVSGANATISLALIGSTDVPVNEADYTAPADGGSTFRDSGGGVYVYNLGTKNLLSGARYRVTATVGATSHSVTISIR